MDARALEEGRREHNSLATRRRPRNSRSSAQVSGFGEIRHGIFVMVRCMLQEKTDNKVGVDVEREVHSDLLARERWWRRLSLI